MPCCRLGEYAEDCVQFYDSNVVLDAKYVTYDAMLLKRAVDVTAQRQCQRRDSMLSRWH